jgi:hypothetical protein
MFLRGGNVSDVAVRGQFGDFLKVQLGLVEPVELDQQQRAVEHQARGPRHLLQAHFDNFESEIVVGIVQARFGHVEIELLVLRGEAHGALEGRESFVGLARAEQGQREQVLHISGRPSGGAQPVQFLDGRLKVPDTEIAEGQVEGEGVVVRHLAARGEEVRDRFLELAAAGEADSFLQCDFCGCFQAGALAALGRGGSDSKDDRQGEKGQGGEQAGGGVPPLFFVRHRF